MDFNWYCRRLLVIIFIILSTYLPLHDSHSIIDIKRRAQRDSAEKTSKFGLNEYGVQNEKLPCSHIHKSVIIIDCHWHGFGRIVDRFDLIIQPANSQ